ncbi:glycosyltransferase family 4 protein [Nodosilinea sp. FACHB-131]|uniref:glycosyltransferase n=1 Tax=Cyanophyceae TaxID=3028117 RepID=UPI0016844D69|nr:glycosyltransferase family 4 protein [Nodosilinea sp. FACHB-131]
MTHAPLLPEYGAAQVAINLGQVFKDLGHEVTLWSPQPVPEVKPWNRSRYMRKKLKDYLETQDTFDIIDCPPIFIKKYLGKKTIVVSRHVQPDLLYILSTLNIDRDATWRNFLSFPVRLTISISDAISIIFGWYIADYIFCLGTHELKWMTKWFPSLREKLSAYYNAISENEQESLKKIRVARSLERLPHIRFLWIGRWVKHKGIKELENFISSWLLSSPQDSFTIAGCGDCETSKSLLRLKKMEQVSIVPNFDRATLLELLNNHDIGLFSSQVEGWGLCLNEMLESGMPVFATNTGGVPDLKQLLGEKVLAFPPNAQSINEVTSQRTFDDIYYNHFSWNSIANSYLEKIFD